MKQQIVHALQKYVLNPPIKLLFALGIAPPGYALLETTGCKSGKVRRTPVGDARVGDRLWIVAEHGMKAGYVRNIKENPRVRLKLREGFLARWHTGTAHLLWDDDPRERQRWLADRGTGSRAMPAPTDPRQRLKDLAKMHDKFTAAISYLRAIRPAGYAVVPQVAIAGVLPPEKFRPIKLFAAEHALRLEALKSTVLAAGTAVTGRTATRAASSSGLGALTAASLATPYLQAGQVMAEKPGLSVGRSATPMTLLRMISDSW